MKQQVNLYQPRLYPVRQSLSLSRLALSWAVLVLLISVLGFGLLQQQRELATQLQQQQQQLDQQLEQVTLFQQALAQRQPPADLVKELQLVEHSVQQKQHLLRYLTQQQQQASQFYSPVLQHLQQIDRPEIWLTGFNLQQHHSSFRGVALRPDAVPVWLEAMRQLSYFRGQRFGQVQMQQVPDKAAVAFELAANQDKAL